jgi:hypothetical protein
MHDIYFTEYQHYGHHQQEQRSGNTPLKDLLHGKSFINRAKARAEVHFREQLGVWAYQLYGYCMHYTWNGALGNLSFERSFKWYRVVLDFCTTAVNGTPGGVGQLYDGTRRLLRIYWNGGRFAVRQDADL